MVDLPDDGIVVFTNGCFDVVHPGHIYLFDECRRLAGPKGKVIVGLNSDESIKRLKGPSRPIFSCEHRLRHLTSLKQIDHVAVFESEAELVELIRMTKPDIVVKGGDYKVESVVGHSFTRVYIVPTLPGFSTTRLIGGR